MKFFRYFSTTDVSHPDFSAETESSLSCDIQMETKQCEYPTNFTCDIFSSVSTTNLLVTKMYTNLHIQQHNITQLIWNHLVHICNI